jgi:glycine/D-amino acid oxidase-like deaminating enzyme
MDSLWEKEVQLPRFAPLDGGCKTDVPIIGGGLAGLLCAYRLQQEGVDYRLVEADRICSGITGSTTAKITLQHGLIYGDLLHRQGLERTQMYLAANQAALDEYRHLSGRIDCDYEEKANYVYVTRGAKKVEREMAALEKLRQNAAFVRHLPLPVSAVEAVKIRGQAQFHPLKFVQALARDLHIHEHTKVQELTPDGASTDRGRIRAKTMIVTTHFPLLNKHGGFFLKLYQHRSYVLALQEAAHVGGMYVDHSPTGLSFRNYGRYLLLGGGGHRTGKRGGGWQELSRIAQAAYPGCREAARWATQDCMSLDGIPYIGQYSKNTPHLFVATGFNKWGMTSAMAAAMILSDLVQGRENPWAPVFDPSRSILHPQLAVNAAETTLHLLKPTAPRCPHMGCALSYNKEEHSWDCPCHGSRFSRDGALLDNPATDDIKEKDHGQPSA